MGRESGHSSEQDKGIGQKKAKVRVPKAVSSRPLRGEIKGEEIHHNKRHRILAVCLGEWPMKTPQVKGE